MYAVIKTGGKQYRVAKDDVITVERLEGDAGGKIEFPEVLMVAGGGSPKVGSPFSFRACAAVVPARYFCSLKPPMPPATLEPAPIRICSMLGAAFR